MRRKWKEAREKQKLNEELKLRKVSQFQEKLWTICQNYKKKHFKNEDERKKVLSMGKIFCSYSNTQYLII